MSKPRAKPIPDLTPDDRVRLWSNILPGGPDACWPWVLSRNHHGYGQINIQGDIYKVSRVVYLAHYGEDPGDLDVCHTCDNPPCCNPKHLFLGTHQDNMADLKAKGLLVRLDLDVDEIFRLSLYMTQREIAKRLGCSQRTIVKILHGIDYHRSGKKVKER